MEKYFVTYQPKKVQQELILGDYIATNTDYKKIISEFGYNPIFFIPLENKLDFLIRNFFSSPSKPDVMIITKLHNYDCIDAAKWYEVKGNEKEYESIKGNIHDDREKEFISNKILKNNVVKIIPVNEFGNLGLNINEDIRTKMLMYLNGFWKSLENYFYSSDDRNMIEFVNSQQFNRVIMQFGENMSNHKMDMADCMIQFRDELTKLI